MGGRINPTSHRGTVAQVNKTGKTTQFATGNATLTAGTVNISTPFINSKSIVLFGRTSINASVAIGQLQALNLTPGDKFTVTSFDAAAATETDDVSIFNWLIVGG